MSRRGFSRGYGRGGGGNNSYRGGGSNYRGRDSSYGSSRNNSRSFNDSYNNYESRNNSRYESYDRDNNRNYKRPTSYNRERERSLDRKRSRHDQVRGNHENFRSSGGGGDYAGGGGYRNDSSSSRNSSGRRSSPPNHHHHHSRSSSSFRNSESRGGSSGRDRDDHRGRDSSLMGPPKRLPPRAIRGRGRPMSLRGRGLISRPRIGRIDSGIGGGRTILKRRFVGSSNGRVRRIIGDRYRNTIRSARSTLLTKKARPSVKQRQGEDGSAEGAEENEEDEEMVDEEEVEEEEGGEEEEAVEGDEEGNKGEGTEEAKKVKKVVKKEPGAGEEEEEAASMNAEDEAVEEGATADGEKKAKKENGEAGGASGDEQPDGAKEEGKEGAKEGGEVKKKVIKKITTVKKKKVVPEPEKLPTSRYTGKTFIKLDCPQCRSSHLTFKNYSRHLLGNHHRMTMRRVSMKLKNQLQKMRSVQRNAQRDLESKEEDPNAKSLFCLLCRLNYRQSKSVHEASDSHKNMEKFLSPQCFICRVRFTTPMSYEIHRSTLMHIKNKAKAVDRNTDDEGSDFDEENIDLENFMTVDSIGDVDDDCSIDNEDDRNGDIDDEAHPEINVGVEHVQKVEVYYCEICRYYLPRKDESETEALIKRHCASRPHLKSFVRYQDDQSLRIEAERIHRRQQEKKESLDKSTDSANAKPKDAEEPKQKDDEEKMSDEEKEVNDDVLQQADEDDEDSRINSERYDRFKYSEKVDDVSMDKLEIEAIDDLEKTLEDKPLDTSA